MPCTYETRRFIIFWIPHGFEQYKFVVITEVFLHHTVKPFISQMLYYANFCVILSDYVYVTLDNTCFSSTIFTLPVVPF